MANIAVFRVSQKQNKWFFKVSILIMAVLICSISLAVFWLSNKLYVASLKKTISNESSSIVHSTNSAVFKDFISDNFPIINSQFEKENGSSNGLIEGMVRGIIGAESFNVRNMLNIEYPVLSTYYSTNPDKQKFAPSGSSAYVSDQNANKTSQGKEEDESEANAVRQTADRIYTPSTVVKSGGIAVTNHTSYKIDIDKLKSESLKTGSIDKKKPYVLLFHTHTSEAYSSVNEGSSTDQFRTENPKFNVVRVGKELATQLSKLGIKSYQDTGVHDFPTYTGSYGRSLETVRKDMKRYPNTKLVLDIHRDADGSKGGMKTAAKIAGVQAAKIMFVVGTDEMGLEHPKWRENLKMAIKLQAKANQLYPGLCKNIDLRKERFNQQVSSGALIVEVGGNGDSLKEAEASMKLLAKVIKEVVK